MASTIKIKNSSTAGAVPTSSDLVQGELAINVTDRRIFTENASGTVVELGTPSIDDNGNATAITIDSSENVGIGNSSPSARITVQQATNDSTVGASFRGYTTSTGDGQRTFLTQYVDSSASYYANNQVRGATHQFYIANAEKARIDSSGSLQVGTTTANSARLSIFGGTGSLTTGIAVQNGGGSGNYFIQFFNSSGSGVGSISQNGASATAFNTSSDYRLKENISPMTGALSVVQQLKPCTYTWKADGSNGQGFIAHELAEIVPDAVTGEKDAVNADGSIKSQGIDTSFLVATLTAAIQELKTIVDTQAARITALEQA